MNNIDLIQKANELFHRLIILDLTMRTLEYDKQHLLNLKMNRPLYKWYDHQLDLLHSDIKQTKKEMSTIGAKGDLKAIKDNDVSIYSLLFRGMNYQYRYHNIALRNHVENELLVRLGLPANSPPTI